MELITILSFIILVATIITFILAVGAYILYKIRERKGREIAAQPVAVHAELVTPLHMKDEREASRTVSDRIYTRVTTQEPVYESTRATSPQLRPNFVSQVPESSRYTALTMEGERYSGHKKFIRDTTATGRSSKPDKKKKEEMESLKWR